ncbi:MAG: RNA polymerase sigma factor [Pyrinomonadaceae bacterium]
MPERTTDEHLLERAGRGDRLAFLELYERHRTAVFRFAYRLLGSVELAEDVTHDCFMALLKKPENFHAGGASLKSYLFAAVRNLAFKHFRDTGREGALDEMGNEPQVHEEQLPLGKLLEEELSEKVRDAILSLPPLQREALILFEYDGLKLAEIAELVGTDVGAVKARLYRARERVKTLLRPYLNSHRQIVTLREA